MSLAQRYVVAIGVGHGAPSDAVPLLRMLVGEAAASRIEKPITGIERTTALTTLRSLRAEWASAFPEAAPQAERLIPAALELAWLQWPAAPGESLALDEALLELAVRLDDPLTPDELLELERIARSGEVERRRRDHAA